MPYLWEQPNLGNNLYERAIIEAKHMGLKLNEKGNSEAIKSWAIKNGGRFQPPSENSPYGTIQVDLDTDEGQKVAAGLKNNGALTEDTPKEQGNNSNGTVQETPAPTETKTKDNTLADDSVSQKLFDEVINILGNLLEKKGIPEDKADGLINTTKAALSGKDTQIPDKMVSFIKDNADDPEKLQQGADALVTAVKSGQLDPTNPPKNTQDASSTSQGQQKTEQKASMPETVKMPPLFKTEPDDSMWQDIVVTEFGIPMINIGNPVAKKVLASENPEQDCPADLKQFKKAVYGDKRLQKVFGSGGLGRIVGGKLTNLLTLGIAGAAADAGKRADRIVKELKEKGGMTTHRNLLMVNYEDIMNADPSSDSPVKVKPYNRSKGQFLGELEVPGTMLAQFYSCVDPKGSPKIYIDMLSKDNSPLKNASSNNNAESANTESAYIQGDPLVEGPIKNIYNAIKNGDNENSNDINRDKEGKQGGNAEIKNAFISYMSNNGYPPMYVLKPKSANKEVVVVSTGSTGQFYGGKVNMVTLKIGEHQAAAFMTPKEIKQYFAV